MCPPIILTTEARRATFAPRDVCVCGGWPCGKWAGCNDGRGAMGDVLDKQCTQCEWYPHSPVQCILLSLKPLFCLSSWLAGWPSFLVQVFAFYDHRHTQTDSTHTHTHTNRVLVWVTKCVRVCVKWFFIFEFVSLSEM